jgi:chemotaxis protein CheD
MSKGIEKICTCIDKTAFGKDTLGTGFNSENTVDVQIGQVKGVKGDAVIQSKAIGSCLGFVIYDPSNKAAVMAHIMLPGRAPCDKSEQDRTKYAENAVEKSISVAGRLNADVRQSLIFVIGAANVLKRKNDTICRDNLRSIGKILKKHNLKITAKSVGGTKRRSISLDLSAGVVYYNKGDEQKTKLWYVH